VQLLRLHQTNSTIPVEKAAGGVHLDNEVGLIVRDQFGGTTRHMKLADLAS
jgi:hypothetical protein